MAQQPHQILAELYEKIAANEKRLDELDQIANNLLQELETLKGTTKTKSGARVPPTKLPDTLNQLEIGRQPKGA